MAGVEEKQRLPGDMRETAADLDVGDPGATQPVPVHGVGAPLALAGGFQERRRLAASLLRSPARATSVIVASPSIGTDSVPSCSASAGTGPCSSANIPLPSGSGRPSILSSIAVTRSPE